MVAKELKNLLSFLTVFPVSMDKDMLTDCAKGMWAFPLIGGFIGLLAGLFGWIGLLFLPGVVVGGLVLGVLLLITGLHHTDGLLDFGDGVMAHGSAERKVEVMHDMLTGTGGLSLGILTFLVSALAFGQLHSNVVVQSLIVVELSAKLSMVVMARAGKAVHKGMNSAFLEAMHGSKGSLRLIVALALSFIIATSLFWLTFPSQWFAGVLVVVVGMFISLIMVAVAHRHFGGVTGDVFGATNDLARMVCAVSLLAVI